MKATALTVNKPYQVVIVQNDDIARLDCETLEEAHKVRRSFVNYGKCQQVFIEGKFHLVEKSA